MPTTSEVEWGAVPTLQEVFDLLFVQSQFGLRNARGHSPVSRLDAIC